VMGFNWDPRSVSEESFREAALDFLALTQTLQQ